MKHLKLVVAILAVVMVLAPFTLASADKKDKKSEIRITVNGEEKVIPLDFSGLEKGLKSLENLDVKMEGLDNLDEIIEHSVSEAMKGVEVALDSIKDIDIDIDMDEVMKEVDEAMDEVDEAMEEVSEALKDIDGVDVHIDMKSLKKQMKQLKKQIAKKIKHSCKHINDKV